MGDNIYAAVLPYKDWVHINNVMRMHEHMKSLMTSMYVGTFLTALSYPTLAAGMLGFYLIVQPYFM